MASKSDSESETEEILLFAEIDGLLCTEILEHDSICVPTFKIIGLDTDKPYMQIGKETFEGEYQDRIGSALFFETDPNPSDNDQTFRKVPENPLRYFGKTDKNLCLSRVFLKSKTESEQKEVTQPIYIDSEDLEALAESEKEYSEMLERFKVSNVTEEEAADLNEHGLETEEQNKKDVSSDLRINAETTNELLPPNTRKLVSVSASTSKPVADSTGPVSDPSAVAEVSQLICEQMDIDYENS